MRAACVFLMTLAVVAMIPPPSATHAQVVTGDSVRVLSDPARSPKEALRRAAFVPGWGQIYNRQYIKLPFVYGALGGLAAVAIINHRDYSLYRDAFQYKAFQELVDSGQRTDNPAANLKGAYDEIAAEFGTISSSPIELRRNNFRRSRDLSVIGIGLVYGLAVLDAYVSAHLLDFDDGEDLSLRVTPVPSGIQTTLRIPLGRR